MDDRDDNPYRPPDAEIGPDARRKAERRKLRDFGVLPADLSARAEPVRSRYKGIHHAMQWGCTSVVGGGMLVGGMILVVGGLTAGWKLDADARMGMFGMAAFLLAGAGGLFYAVADTNVWVEIDGRTVRARRLFTGRIIERDVAEITEVVTLAALVRSPSNRIAESVLGRVRGFQIRFPDLRRGLSVQLPEMDNVQELLDALYARMSEVGAIEAEVVSLEGKPIVKRVTWKRPPKSSE